MAEALRPQLSAVVALASLLVVVCEKTLFRLLVDLRAGRLFNADDEELRLFPARFQSNVWLSQCLSTSRTKLVRRNGWVDSIYRNPDDK